MLRADPKKKGILYAGTETGMYVSFDDGFSWNSFQLNLPIVPITDLTIKENSLIVATQGRSIWTIDDLTVLHQIDQNTQSDQGYHGTYHSQFDVCPDKRSSDKSFGGSHHLHGLDNESFGINGQTYGTVDGK